ncbi:MAG: carboxypeptidase-like regulatory domain-containing protein, partial [Bacteroidota bacterium]
CLACAATGAAQTGTPDPSRAEASAATPVTLDLGRVSREAALRAIRDASGLRLVWQVGSAGLQDSVLVRFERVPAADAVRAVLDGSPLGVSVSASGIVRVRTRPTGTVTGRVVDAASGDPLPGAAVLVAGTLLGDAADLDGRFTIDAVPEGPRAIEASLLGYRTARDSVVVRAGEATEVEVALVESSLGLSGVVVEAETEAARIEATAQAVAVLDLREARVQTADLGEVLARAEGVAVQRAGGLGSNERVSLNGLTGDQIRFFFNGLPLGLAGYPFGISNVPAGLVERAEVYKGVVPIRFGADALGGAINLVSPEPLPGASGSASYQVGSFGTHRTAAEIGYLSERTGLFARGAGFFDFARNDYEVDVFVADERGLRTEVTAPRFNDRYRGGAGNLTLGVRDRTWADELSVTGYVVDFARQIQNNATMSGLPFGEAEQFGTTLGVNATYRAAFSERVSLDVVGGYSRSSRSLLDVARCRYNWLGECILETRRPGEIFLNRGTDQTLWDDDAFARLAAEWRVSDRHTIRLTTAPTFNGRTGENALITTGTDLLSGENQLTTWVSGAEYQFGGAGERFENRLFVKDYRQLANSALPGSFGVTFVTNRSTASLLGIGNVARVAWTERLSTKLSYEWATRLPRRDELFGNGLEIAPNAELLDPERSHNANLEVTLRSARGARTPWFVQANGFARVADDLILRVPRDDFAEVFRNVFSATSLGVELSARATLLGERLTLDANTTYQSFRNTSSEGFFASFEGDRIPNRPFFFANAAARYRTGSPVRRSDRLDVFASVRHVQSFFRTWESLGRRDFAAEIPTQTTVAVGATYDLALGRARWAMTGEVQNLTDAQVFDLFGVQRPGRAVYLKLTTRL